MAREHHHHCAKCQGGIFGGWGLGFIGALVYFMQQANGFGAVVTGILKAFVWPAFLVHKLFGL
jgi:hypothetical protein